MAGIGLKYLICAPVTETDTAVTYTSGMVMSYAIKADLSIELIEGKLYGDNRLIENIKEFKSGKLTLNGDHLGYEVLALVLGQTVTTLTTPNAGKKLTAKGDDDGAFVGVGFYASTIKDSVRGYRAIWLHKVKFGIPNESLETKGEAINFQTPTIEGTVLLDRLGVWKDEAIFDTEAGAKAWLDNISNMGGIGD